MSYIAMGLYFAILCVITVFANRSSKKTVTSHYKSTQLNYWVTALSAHASDMSAWLLMGLPGAVYLSNSFSQVWTAVGLVTFMYLNWELISPVLKKSQLQHGCYTITGFIESRTEIKDPYFIPTTLVLSLLFLSLYICSGFVALGNLFESIFQIPFSYGLFLSVVLILCYTTLGGFYGIALVDTFQALFLLAVILMFPMYMTHKYPMINSSLMTAVDVSTFSTAGVFSGFILSISWGLGYFGQPHILNKFFSIAKIEDLKRSRIVGICWQIVALSMALLIGLQAIWYFKNFPTYVTKNFKSEFVFVKMVSTEFTPFIATFVLCAILAAIISTIDSQIMAFTSNVVKRLGKTYSTVITTNQISKLVTATITIASAFCAYHLQDIKIYQMVQFAWSGFGIMFGPIILYLRFNKHISESLIQKTILTCVLTMMITTTYLRKILLFTIEDSVSISFLLSFLLHITLLVVLRRKKI